MDRTCINPINFKGGDGIFGIGSIFGMVTAGDGEQLLLGADRIT